MQKSCICLIPARSDSQRIRKKNIKMLEGHPLIAYTIQVAKDSGIFSRIIVSTNDKKIAEISKYYGAGVPFLRPKKYATSTSPDIEWVALTLKKLAKEGKIEDCFAILRPTSPFRRSSYIRRGWKTFLKDPKADSLRAVEKCAQHPAKMWKIHDNRMVPIIKTPEKDATPLHSKPYQSLPEVYVQNASLEIARTHLPLEQYTISGNQVRPFISEGFDGYDINTYKDWVFAEKIIEEGLVRLPKISKKPFSD